MNEKFQPTTNMKQHRSYTLFKFKVTIQHSIKAENVFHTKPNQQTTKPSKFLSTYKLIIHIIIAAIQSRSLFKPLFPKKFPNLQNKILVTNLTISLFKYDLYSIG